MGSTSATSKLKPATNCGNRRTHQMSRRRSGTAAMRGANWKLSPADAVSRLLTYATSRSTAMKSTNCTSPVSDV